MMPTNGCPATVNATSRTSPAFVLGLSDGDREMASIRLSGKIDA